MELGPEEMLVVDDLKPGYDTARQRHVHLAAAGWAYDAPATRTVPQPKPRLYFGATEELYRYLFE